MKKDKLNNVTPDVRSSQYDILGVGLGGKRLQLSQSVAMSLREQIISGKLRKGDFLRIDSISSQLGVSSTPVREGLLLLQNESYVQLIPRRGFVVTGFSKDDVLDLFWAQATIGAELAARAAKNMTEADVAGLQKLHGEHESVIAAGNQEESARLGHEFHRRINLAAAAPRLSQVLGGLTKQLPNRFYASIDSELDGASDYHPMLINAIRMGDADSARSLMFRHINSAAKHLVSMLEKNGGFDSSGEEASPPLEQDGK